MSPKLAVIMPICNGAATLGAAFRSIIEAGAQDLEIIAVIQRSEDASREIVAEAAKRLPIRIIDTGADSNWVRNTNIGLTAANAEFATMLHQDDIWLPGRMAVVDQMIDTCPDASLWVHPARYIDDSGRQIGLIGPPFGRRPRLVPGKEALRTLIVQNSIPLPGAVFRRHAAVEGGGLREDLWYTADWELWLRLAAQGGVGWCPQAAAAFRLHVNSQTVRGSVHAKDFAGQLRAPIDLHAPAQTCGRDRQLLRMARASVALNSFLAARYHHQQASFGPFLKDFLLLGPVGWARFLNRSQIAARIWPRVRLFLFRRQVQA